MKLERKSEKVLYKYRVYKRMEKIKNKVPNVKVTPVYEAREHGNTNVISKPVEGLVVREIDAEQERQEFIGLVESCIEELEGIKKDLILERYVKKDYITNSKVALEILGISNHTFKKTRDAAIKEMAYYLGITNDLLD